jgi:hypothetical protein
VTLAGYKFRGHEGERIVVVGESLLNPGYVDVLVDGEPSCRPVGPVLRRIQLEQREEANAQMATKTAPRKKTDEAKAMPNGEESNAERYARLLAALLKNGKPVSSREIHDAMAKAGASDSMVGRAKRELGDVSVRRMKGNGDERPRYYWSR